MRVLRSLAELSALKSKLDSGELFSHNTSLIARGCLLSALKGLWHYEAVLDDGEKPTTVILRPKKGEPLPFVNRDVFVLSTNHDHLKKLLLKDDILPWTEKINFKKVSVHLQPTIESCCVAHGGTLHNVYDDIFYPYMDKGKFLAEKGVPLPEGFFIDRLRPSHTSLLLHHWDSPQKADLDEWQGRVKLMVSNLPSYCIYDKDGQPVSWSATYLEGGGGLAHTLPEYRNHRLFFRGAQFWQKGLQEQRLPVFSLVAKHNELPIKALKDWYEKIDDPLVFLTYRPESQEQAKL